MPRRKLVTADVINQIESWVDDGLNPKAIAEKIGCTLGTLRVRCLQFGISLRRKTRAVGRGPPGIVADRNTGLGSGEPQNPARDCEAMGNDKIPLARMSTARFRYLSRSAEDS